MKDWLRNIFKDKKGMGTVEVILIIVVLVGLVIIFKGKITGVVNDIFEKIGCYRCFLNMSRNCWISGIGCI